MPGPTLSNSDDLLSEIKKAIFQFNLKVLKKIFKKNPSLLDRSVLGFIIDKNDPKLLKVALEVIERPRKKEVLNQFENDLTPLMQAAKATKKSKKIVVLLMRHGADIHINNHDAMNALHYAAESGSTGVIKKLIENGVKPDMGNVSGWQPIHFAAYYGHLETVRYLIKQNVNIDAPNEIGETPLYLAAETGHSVVCEYLIKKDAQIEASNAFGMYPLYAAVQRGNAKTVKVFLNNKANVFGTTTTDTLLHQATYRVIREPNADSQAIFNLICKEIDTQLFAKERRGQSYLVRENFVNKVDQQTGIVHRSGPLRDHTGRRLAQHNLDLTNGSADKANNQQRRVNNFIKNRKGGTPLMWIATTQHIDIAKKLIDIGAKVTWLNKQGEAAINWAIEQGPFSMVGFLVKQGGASLSATPYDNVLYQALQRNTGREVVLGYLIRTIQKNTNPYLFGQIIDEQDINGDTLLTFLAKNHDDIVTCKLILQYGVSINLKNSEGKSALQIAIEKGHINLAHYLLKRTPWFATSALMDQAKRNLDKIDKEKYFLEHTQWSLLVKKIETELNQQDSVVKLTYNTDNHPSIEYDLVQDQPLSEFVEELPDRGAEEPPDRGYDGSRPGCSHWPTRFKRSPDGCLSTKEPAEPQWEEFDWILSIEKMPKEKVPQAYRMLRRYATQSPITKLNIDSKKFFEQFKNYPKKQQAQIAHGLTRYETAITGSKQTELNRLIKQQRHYNAVRQHLIRCEHGIALATRGLNFKPAITALLRGDLKEVVIDIGLFSADIASRKLTSAFVGMLITRIGIIGIDSTSLLVLRAASRSVATRVSPLLVYDLIQSIKDYRAGNQDALVSVITDSSLLTIDAIGIGLEVLEIIGISEGLSAAFGPIGMVLSAIILIGTEIYTIEERLSMLEKFHLSLAEKFNEGFRAFLGKPPSENFLKKIQRIDMYANLMESAKKIFEKTPQIGRVIISTDQIVPLCRKSNSLFCMGILCVDPPRKRIVCDGSSLREHPDSKVDLTQENDKLIDTVLVDPDQRPVVADTEIFCFTVAPNPVTINGAPFTKKAKRCDHALGVATTKNLTSANIDLFNLGHGNDQIVADENRVAYFLVGDGHKNFTGSQNDKTIFFFHGNQTCGIVISLNHQTTLDISDLAPAIQTVLIDLPKSKIQYQNGLLHLSGEIATIHGRRNAQDLIDLSCNLEQIDGQAGSSDYPDIISFPSQQDCSKPLNLTVGVHAHTQIYNPSKQGTFLYAIYPESGPAIINLTDSQANHHFVFNCTLFDLDRLTIGRHNESTDAQFILKKESMTLTITPLPKRASYLFTEDNAELFVNANGTLHYAVIKLPNNKPIGTMIEKALTINERLQLLLRFILPNKDTIYVNHSNSTLIEIEATNGTTHIIETNLNNQDKTKKRHTVYILKAADVNQNQSLPIPRIAIFQKDTQDRITLDLSQFIRQLNTTEFLSTKIREVGGDLELKFHLNDGLTRLRVTLRDFSHYLDLFDFRLYRNIIKITQDDPARWKLSPEPLNLTASTVILSILEPHETIIWDNRACGLLYHFRTYDQDLFITNIPRWQEQDHLCSLSILEFYKKSIPPITLQLPNRLISLPQDLNLFNNASVVHLYELFNDDLKRLAPINAPNPNLNHSYSSQEKFNFKREAPILPTNAGNSINSWNHHLIGLLKPINYFYISSKGYLNIKYQPTDHEKTRNTYDLALFKSRKPRVIEINFAPSIEGAIRGVMGAIIRHDTIPKPLQQITKYFIQPLAFPLLNAFIAWLQYGFEVFDESDQLFFGATQLLGLNLLINLLTEKFIDQTIFSLLCYFLFNLPTSLESGLWLAVDSATFMLSSTIAFKCTQRSLDFLSTTSFFKSKNPSDSTANSNHYAYQ
jgi:ankyrin repeat protein